MENTIKTKENVSCCLKGLLSEFAESVVLKGNYQSIFDELLPKYTNLVLLQCKCPYGRVLLTEEVVESIRTDANSPYSPLKGRGIYHDVNGNECAVMESFVAGDIFIHKEDYPYIVWYEGGYWR